MPIDYKAVFQGIGDHMTKMGVATRPKQVGSYDQNSVGMYGVTTDRIAHKKPKDVPATPILKQAWNPVGDAINNLRSKITPTAPTTRSPYNPVGTGLDTMRNALPQPGKPMTPPSAGGGTGLLHRAHNLINNLSYASSDEGAKMVSKLQDPKTNEAIDTVTDPVKRQAMADETLKTSMGNVLGMNMSGHGMGDFFKNNWGKLLGGGAAAIGGGFLLHHLLGGGNNNNAQQGQPININFGVPNVGRKQFYFDKPGQTA